MMERSRILSWPFPVVLAFVSGGSLVIGLLSLMLGGSWFEYGGWALAGVFGWYASHHMWSLVQKENAELRRIIDVQKRVLAEAAEKWFLEEHGDHDDDRE